MSEYGPARRYVLESLTDAEREDKDPSNLSFSYSQRLQATRARWLDRRRSTVVHEHCTN